MNLNQAKLNGWKMSRYFEHYKTVCNTIGVVDRGTVKASKEPFTNNGWSESVCHERTTVPF